MKILYLLRHAKSSWDDASLSDFERPLNDRGEKSAPAVGKFMRSEGYLPEIIISSPAVRARRTAEIVNQEIGCKIRFEENIYAAATSELLAIVSNLDDAISSAMLVGHNPGFEHLVSILTGEYEAMPTAALAVIDLNTHSWSTVAPGKGVLRNLFRPKDLV